MPLGGRYTFPGRLLHGDDLIRHADDTEPMTLYVKSTMCASKMRTPRHRRREAPCKTMLLDQVKKQADPAPAPSHETDEGADYPHPTTPCRHVRRHSKGRETEVDAEGRGREGESEQAREKNQMGRAVQGHVGVDNAFDPERPAMPIGVQQSSPFLWEDE